MATRQFYRKKNPETGVEDFYESGTNKYIGLEEFGKGAGFAEEKAQVAPDRLPAEEASKRRIEEYSSSPLEDYKQNRKFLDLVKEAVQRKQGFNKDIQSAKTYWRTEQRDPITFTDERLQLLSPTEQQALREKRYATAGANLKGLSEEEAYRGGRLEDVVGRMIELQEAKTAEEERKRGAEIDDLNILSKRKELGYEPTIEDVYGTFVSPDGQRVGEKVGGTASWRNNNPGNIKFRYGNGQISGVAQRLLDAGIAIKEGSPATDGGSFIAFPDEETGDKTMKELLTSDAYKNLTIEEAMRKWSGKGYGADVMQYPVSTTIGRLNDKQLEDLISGMKKREGYKEGEILNQTDSIEHETWTPAAVRSLAKKTGKSSTELLNNYTDEELDALERSTSISPIDDVVAKIDSRKLLQLGIQNKDVLSYILTLKYELGASDQEMVGLLEDIGVNPKTKDGRNVLDELDLLVNPL